MQGNFTAKGKSQNCQYLIIREEGQKGKVRYKYRANVSNWEKKRKDETFRGTGKS